MNKTNIFTPIRGPRGKTLLMNLSGVKNPRVVIALHALLFYFSCNDDNSNILVSTNTFKFSVLHINYSLN